MEEEGLAAKKNGGGLEVLEGGLTLDDLMSSDLGPPITKKGLTEELFVRTENGKLAPALRRWRGG